MQIQAAFAEVRLADLGRLGTKVYDLIPSFRDRCPLCRGTSCAVRHGVYYRRVVDVDGRLVKRLPVPRFRCRRRGSFEPAHRTFSVLPASAVSRRRFSLPLMLRIVDLVRRWRSIPQVLDDLATAGEQALVLEEVTIFRVLFFFASIFLGLGEEEGRMLGLGADPGTTRGRALALAGSLAGGPVPSVLTFHRQFCPRLLLAVHTP
jgi:hypothetical protein